MQLIQEILRSCSPIINRFGSTTLSLNSSSRQGRGDSSGSSCVACTGYVNVLRMTARVASASKLASTALQRGLIALALQPGRHNR